MFGSKWLACCNYSATQTWERNNLRRANLVLIPDFHFPMSKNRKPQVRCLRRKRPRTDFCQGQDRWKLKWRRCVKTVSFNGIEIFRVIDSHFVPPIHHFLRTCLSFISRYFEYHPLCDGEAKNGGKMQSRQRQWEALCSKDISKHYCESS